MDNPKLVIETNGKQVEVFVDGKQIKGITDITFSASVGKVFCEIEKYTLDETGAATFNEEKTQLLKEKVVLMDNSEFMTEITQEEFEKMIDKYMQA